MNIEKKILLEENNLKPNKYTAKAMFWVMLGAICIAVLNEIGVFQVHDSAMRISMLLVVICSVLIQICGQLPQIASKHSTKYVILMIVMVEVLIVTTVLGQWGELFMFLPLALALQYHSKKITTYCYIGTILIAMLAAPLNCLLGLAQLDYYVYLIRSCGYKLGAVTHDPIYNRVQYAMDLFRYISVSRGIVAASIGAISFYITKLDSANIESRVTATVYSRVDALTGIHNRFSFEAKLLEYEHERPKHLICVYADADGLHNFNETHGHDTGDTFLKVCAGQMVHNFGELTYRMGGDEFLSFIEHSDLEKVQAGIRRIQQDLDEYGYHMSLGVSELKDKMSLHKLISIAEKQMYAQKGEYYIATGMDRRRN